MPGQMGNKQVTAQNLEVVMIDEPRNLVMVKGSVPGFDSAFVTIKDSVKISKQPTLPMPAGLKAKAETVVETSAETEVKE